MPDSRLLDFLRVTVTPEPCFHGDLLTLAIDTRVNGARCSTTAMYCRNDFVSHYDQIMDVAREQLRRHVCGTRPPEVFVGGAGI